jgi:hypothetical protein
MFTSNGYLIVIGLCAMNGMRILHVSLCAMTQLIGCISVSQAELTLVRLHCDCMMQPTLQQDAMHEDRKMNSSTVALVLILAIPVIVLVIAWIAFEWDMARYNASYIFSGRKRN